jgi:hypothetical protein
MSRLTAALAALVLTLTAGQASANLIVNGTFESAVPGNPLLPAGWTVGNFGFFSHLIAPPAPDPDGGSTVMSLSNFAHDDFATIAQDLTTVNGASYNLSYWFFSTGVSSASPPGIEFRVLWNGNVVEDLVNPPPASAFSQHTLTLTGTGHDTLEFAGFNDPGFNYLDDVVLDGPSPAVVPEPSGVSVFGLMWALGLLTRAWRRKLAAVA